MEDENKLENANQFKEEKKQKILNWLKNKYNLIFLAILIFAIAVRLYYLDITIDQPLWWDESDYMAYAKTIAGFSSHWTVTGAHSSIFPYLAAFFFKFGSSEAIVKFFLEIIPSILIVLLTYKITVLMYSDKRIALISSFLMATLWEMLFNSMRFHLEAPALLFGFLAVYSFWQGYERKERIFGKIAPHWAIPLTVFFVTLTYATRRGYFLFGFFFLFYMLFTREFKSLLKDKYNWIALIMLIVIFLLVEKFIFAEIIVESSKLYVHPDSPIRLVDLQVFGAYFNNMNGIFSSLLYLFYFGFIILTFSLFIPLSYFKQLENKKARSDLFIFLTLALTFAYFILIQRNQSVGEPRWYFPILLATFASISKGTLFIADYIKKYSKHLSILVILVLIGYGGYYELQHADTIIKARVNSFNGVKQIALFVKEVSNKDDMLIGMSNPQVGYYAERKSRGPVTFKEPMRLDREGALEEFLSELEKEENRNIRYIYVTFSEPNHPEWMKKEVYLQNPQTGQVMLAKFEIPFMNTSIDFTTGQQDIKQSKTYGDIEFRLLRVVDDAFLYEINRLN